jgi:hypothetical protein
VSYHRSLPPRRRAGYHAGIDWRRLNTLRAIFDSGASRLSGPVTVGRVSVLKARILAVRVCTIFLSCRTQRWPPDGFSILELSSE